MKKIITSILSLAFLSGLFVNHSFAEGIQPAESTQESASNVLAPEQQDSSIVASSSTTAPVETVSQTAKVDKSNVVKKSIREKLINKKEEREKKFSDSVNKEIEKVKNMSEKEFKRYLYKSYLILYGPLCLVYIVFLFFGFFQEKLEVALNKIDLYAYRKGFEREENKQSIKKDLNTSNYDHLFISELKKGIKPFLINFHPDVLSKNIKDPTFLDKIFPDLEALYNKAKYFCDKGFFTGKPN